MNDETRLPADVALLKRCRKAGFSARKAESMVVELFRIEKKMQHEVKELSERMDSRFSEIISRMDAGFAAIRSEMATKAEVKAVEDRLLQVISWRLVIFMAVFTVMGAGLFALMGRLFVP